MLVVDLLHEFELGVWKSLFMQLVRLLYAAGQGSKTLVAELDARSLGKYSVFNNIIHVLVSIDIAKSQHLAVVPYGPFLKIPRK